MGLMRTVSASVAALAVSLCSGAALAQNGAAQPEADRDQPPPQSGKVQDIVVTAQRVEQRAQSIPIAITALTEDKLQDVHLTSVSELTFLAPALNVVSAQGLVKPYLRGVGTQGAIAGIEMPVAIYQDGVYIAAAPAPMFGFTDIQRVEVIKGPQGTLFGRNATGGLISITSRDPKDEFQLSASATLATYATREADLFVGGGLAAGVRASIYARYADQGDGFGVNRATGSGTYKIGHDIDLRGKLLLDPAGGTRIAVIGDYVDRDSTLNTARFFGQRSLLNAQPLPSTWDSNSNVEPINHFKGGGGLVRVEQDVGSLVLTSLTAYRKSRFHYGVDTDMSPLSVLSSEPVQKDRQFSQELQLRSDAGGPVRWIAGLFLFDATAHLRHFTRFGGPLSPLPTSNATRDIVSSSTTRSYAGFGQVDIKLGDSTTVTGGLRYTVETRGFDAIQTFVRNNGTIASAAFNPADLEYRRLTWRASLDHKFSDAVMGYASYNRGFKSGGFNPTVPGDPAYLPETIDAYEIGFKSDLLGRSLRLNGAAFLYDYTNMQVSYFQNGVTGIYNGASARLWGVETSLVFVPDQHFTLNADVSYLKTRFTRFPNGIRAVALANGGYQQLANQDLTGNRTPNAPKLAVTVGGDFRFDTAIGRIGFNASWYYNDGFPTEPDNVLRQPSYHLINLSAKWTSLDEKLYARLWVKNMLSAEVTTQLNVTPLGAITGFQPPAVVGVTFGLNL